MFPVSAQLRNQPRPLTHGQVAEAPHSFPLGARVLSLGRYLVDLSDGDSEHLHSCLDLTTGDSLRCRAYPIADFHRKAQLLLADYEGVCRTKDVCVLQDKVFVISQKTFGDLHNFLKRRKRLPEAQAAPIFHQIVHLVREAHRRDTALRDLKLKKFVFVDHQSSTLLLQNLHDAQFLEDGKLTERHGCPAYVSPEMLQPGSYSGKAADLWSLGVILYTLLVGHYPFFDANPQTLFSMIRSGYYHTPDHLSYLAKNVISSLLAYEPEYRVSASVILEHPWFTQASDSVWSPPSPKQQQLDQTVPMKDIY